MVHTAQRFRRRWPPCHSIIMSVCLSTLSIIQNSLSENDDVDDAFDETRRCDVDWVRDGVPRLPLVHIIHALNLDLNVVSVNHVPNCNENLEYRLNMEKRIDVDNQKISESILQFKIVVKLVSYDKSIFCINSIFWLLIMSVCYSAKLSLGHSCSRFKICLLVCPFLWLSRCVYVNHECACLYGILPVWLAFY